ncbi:hypothetical protein GDO81_015089 [Engystomops pustulosus]|uniref:Uncharacterized protein n=1 Tax=Engystomops pustulosus TaxID=76066 RepID=A0AAV7AMS2_ENGPU|nr:hypothetical protein GDO81_015089 [Engystomops pustulosus]
MSVQTFGLYCIENFHSLAALGRPHGVTHCASLSQSVSLTDTGKGSSMGQYRAASYTTVLIQVNKEAQDSADSTNVSSRAAESFHEHSGIVIIKAVKGHGKLMLKSI